jgi:outer membrane protein TolC
VPIRNRAAKGVYKRAELTTRQAEQQREKVKQQIILAVRMAMRAVDTSRTLVESTRQTRMLQETNVAAEEKRLKLGVTTSYHVLQVQEDLTTARTAEVQSLTSFEKAVAELQLAEGTVLKNFGVEFEQAAGAKPAVGAKPAQKPAAS